MTHLLDTNLLIALLDRAHEFHDLAQDWFVALHSPWATCPITENGVVRILSGSGYRNALSTDEALEALARLRQLGAHQFWTDNISLFDSSIFRRSGLQRHHQITDSYLLGLAVAHGGRFATLDKRMSTRAVQDGTEALFVVEL